MAQLIVYACPTGTLAEQLQAFFAASLVRCGKNTAHRYMPHCTLTGFFDDREPAIPLYTAALALASAKVLESRPDPILTITGLNFKSDWHGLELISPWLQTLTREFAQQAKSPTRQTAIRLKTWLHLSLAYDFPASQADLLQDLACSMIDPQAPATWELRFYQRNPENQWICHQALDLSSQV